MAIPRPGHRGGSTVASAVTASFAVLALAGCTAAGPSGDAANADGSPSPAGPASTGSTAATPAVPHYADLFPSMVAAVAAMKTARVSGRITEGSVPVSVDIRGTMSDSEAYGDVVDAAGPITLLRIKGATYVRATREYWNKQIGRRSARAIGTSWVALPAQTPLGAVTVGALIRQTFDFTPDDASLRDSTVTKSQLGKLPVYVVTSPDGLRTLYVSAAGRPLPMRYTVRAPASGASADPSSALPVTPPASAGSSESSPAAATAGPSAPATASSAGSVAPGTSAPGAANPEIVTDIWVTHWNEVAAIQAPKAHTVLTS